MLSAVLPLPEPGAREAGRNQPAFKPSANRNDCKTLAVTTPSWRGGCCPKSEPPEESSGSRRALKLTRRRRLVPPCIPAHRLSTEVRPSQAVVSPTYQQVHGADPWVALPITGMSPPFAWAGQIDPTATQSTQL
jgi:hypothetical protein